MLIRLDLNLLKILRRKEHWELYFILLTEKPGEEDNTILTIIPKNGTIAFRNRSDNFHSFKPKGEGTDGLSIYCCKSETGNSVKARLYLMHSRKKLRNSNKLLMI